MRLPDYAEFSFARACAAGDAIPHPPKKDENGWDYMVEFDGKAREGHADTRPPASKAFVQIKSTSRNQLACSIKLSNALKAAQSSLPWFVVLYVSPKGLRKTAAYAKHIWQSEIEQALRAVRLSEKEGTPLNRRRLTISFDKSDKKTEEDLVPWMEMCIDSVKPDYYRAKKAIYETTGFENGYAIGKISFAVENEDALFANFLGLGDGLLGTNISLTPTRFGIEDTTPHVTMERALIHITPTPSGSCEIRLRGPKSAPAISVPAKVYALGEPIVSPDRRRFRFSGTGVELVWSLDGYTKFDFSLNYNDRLPLRDIQNFATLMRWSSGPIDLQIWSDKGRIIGGTLNSDGVFAASTFDWSKLIDVTAMLRLLAGTANEESLTATIVEFNRDSSALYFMYQVLSAPSLRMEFIPILDIPESSAEVLYYASADVGELTAYVIVERPLKNIDDLENGEKRLDFGAPIIRESWVVRNATSSQRAMIANDYATLVKSMQALGHDSLELGDIRALHKQGLSERSALTKQTHGGPIVKAERGG